MMEEGDEALSSSAKPTDPCRNQRRRADDFA
jgi:hypothetical protein